MIAINAGRGRLRHDIILSSPSAPCAAAYRLFSHVEAVKRRWLFDATVIPICASGFIIDVFATATAPSFSPFTACRFRGSTVVGSAREGAGSALNKPHRCHVTINNLTATLGMISVQDYSSVTACAA